MSPYSPRPSPSPSPSSAPSALRPPLRADSATSSSSSSSTAAGASPHISPTSPAPFSFPQQRQTAVSPSSLPPPIPASSAAPPLPPTSSAASTSRFNAAFASLPSSNRQPNSYNPSYSHTAHSSVSSTASDSSLRWHAHDSSLDGFGLSGGGEYDSPLEDRAFGAFQREIAAGGVGSGLGLVDDHGGRALGNGYPREMGRLYEEPEEYDTLRGARGGGGGGGGGGGYGEEEGRRSESAARPFRSGTATATEAAGLGRPASVDLDASSSGAGAGVGSFLLSPPPSFDPTTASAKQFAAAAANDAPRQGLGQKERTGRERIFPAPLLLKGDRSYSLSGSSGSNGANGGANGAPTSPVFPPTQPLSIPRRPSATAAAFAAAGSASSSTVSSPGQSYQRSWSRSGGGGGGEREGPMGPPSSTMDGSQSRLAYHRRQQSSTSSLSHGGSYLPYNSGYSFEPRHQATLSSSTASTASPSLGSSGRSTAFPTPATSSVPLPSITAHAPTPAPPSSSGGVPSAPSSTASWSTSDPPISAQALLLHVLSLRSASSPMALSQSQGPLSRAQTPLYDHRSGLSVGSHQRVRSASSSTSAEPETDAMPRQHRERERDDRSPSRPHLARLDTVDLSHRRIADVPLEVVLELRDEVEKLALGYNLLRDLPPYFSQLGNRLKYLNVRTNMLTVFPAVLCEMPSIEILDISRNKIRKLPSNPGTLIGLKVFSIAKNRVKRLPVWFTSMTHLKVLKLDVNPLEWPPKDVAFFSPISAATGQPMTKQEEADEMQKWVPKLVKWMRENREGEVEREREREVQRAREGEKRRRPSYIEPISEDERPGSDERRPLGMIRTESGRLHDHAPPSRRPSAVDLPSLAEESSPSSASTLDPSSVRHSRNASHSTTQSTAPSRRPGLRAKKSLPDLRQSHADILAERRTGTTLEEEPPRPVVPNLDGPLRRLKEEKHPGLSHSTSARAALPTQAQAAIAPPTSAPSPAPPAAASIVRSQSARPTQTPSPPAQQPRQGTAPLPDLQNEPKSSSSSKPNRVVDLDALLKSKRADVDRPVAGDFERNSGAYFRRLSMLPASTIAKTVPVALLTFADAIRGILFALSQIYSALRQFIVFASQDRLPTLVVRLLSSADKSMSGLINALDRFDSLSRRGCPEAEIVRDVFSSCRDNVAVFGRLVGALQPQLKALTATADARYTRTLLLMLYGSMGEIATSWTAVVHLFAGADDDAAGGGATLVLQPPTPSPQLESKPPTTASPPDSSVLSSSTSNSGSRLTRQRSTTRRHAGSFSVEDVQLGAVLPPAEEVPPVPALPFGMDDGGLSSSFSLAPGESFNGYASTASNATLRAAPPRPTLSAKSSASSATSAGSAGGGTGGGGGSRAPPPGGLVMPQQLGYEEMAQKAFEHPITPGVQGLIERTTGGGGGGEYLPSRGPSRAGSISGPAAGAGFPPAPFSSIAANAPPTSWATPPYASSSSASSSSAATAGHSSSPAAAPRPQRMSRPVSTLNADEMFMDQAESTMAIAADVYGMLLDSFEDDPYVADQFARISGGRRKLKELGELCKAGNEVTARLREAVEKVRARDGEDGRGRLKFFTSDAAELGTAAFEYVQNVIRTAKLMKSVSQELAFPQQLKDAVGQLTLGTREFARLLSHGKTSFRPAEGAAQGSSSSPSASGGGEGGGRGRAGTITGGGGGGREGAGGGGGGEGLPEVRSRDFGAV
ncbi:hypothetical protein JCM8097_008122 [Rhodosporidiobolus ruineniae]